MLENRSFDHMLGYLEHPDKGFRGALEARHYNKTIAGERIEISKDGEPDLADPDHAHNGVMQQIRGHAELAFNAGFVRSYEERTHDEAKGRLVMRCLDPATHCKNLAELALQFAVCDAWHSSVPGQTWPNRNFAHAATSDGATDIEPGFFYDDTIFQQLTRAGVSWRIYYDGPPQIWCFRRLWRRQTLADFVFHRIPKIGNWFTQDQFYEHVRDNDLPAYTFIEPAHFSEPGSGRQTNSQHPHNNIGNYDDFYAGEQLIKDVYESLAHAEELFRKTLLLITYDEHGGLYDHVEPPEATPPNDSVWRAPLRRIVRHAKALIGRLGGREPEERFDFRQLGVRVPAVLVSPWIAPQTVVHTDLEHASIPATVRALFAPGVKSLTRRDETARPFHDVVRTHGVDSPRRPPPLPMVERPARSHVAAPGARELSDVEHHLVQLSEKVHRRLARPPLFTRRRPPQAPSEVPRGARPQPVSDSTVGRATSAFEASAHAARRSRGT
jgi:phospholipase C